MTTLELRDHLSFAHDALAYGRLLLDGRRLSVAWEFSDGTSHTEPMGLVNEPGVWGEACKAAGVESCRLEERDGRVYAEVEYEDGGDDSLCLTALDSAGAWRCIPDELFDDFEKLVDEHEEALAYGAACRAEDEATYRRQQGF